MVGSLALCIFAGLLFSEELWSAHLSDSVIYGIVKP
jgi:hypothetical protein